VHGANGLGDVVFPEPTTKAVVTPAPQLIREIVHKYPHEVSIIAIGMETNVALALREEPGLASLIDEVVVMGGSLLRGNATPAAEANIYYDPEAARIVFHSGVKLTMVGLDPLLDGGFSEEDLQKLAASDKKVAQAAAKIAAARWASDRARPAMWYTSPKSPNLADPAAMAAFLDRSLFQWEQLYVDVETSGELTAGMTVPYRVAPMRRSQPLLGQPETSSLISDTFKPNCSAAVHVDGPRWVKMMMELLTR
jgi:inosine-uridine nucleoside N-ribohydrolase